MQASARTAALWTAALAGVVALAWLWSLPPLRDWLTNFSGTIHDRGFVGFLGFAAVYVLAVVALAPAALLAIAAGALFGAVAFPLVIAAALLGALIACVISRYLVRARVARFIASRPLLTAIDEAIAFDSWKVVALLRLTPLVPFTLQNYLL
ncbi:MAG: VTT domain-containing protein, partial [Proteobacteria bacterium]|nr:VTT domain-containing protein [Pseudomonadota bacterium]